MRAARTRTSQSSTGCRTNTNLSRSVHTANPIQFAAPPVDPHPGFSMTDKPQQVIDAMDVSTYFNMMTRLMDDAAPPAPEDAPIVARMAKIGLVPGQKFDITRFDAAAQARLNNVPKSATAKIL